MTTNRSNYQVTSLIAKNRELSCDSWATGLNANQLVLGPSGAGKTRDFLKPNLMQMGSSFVVLDTKGTLRHEVGPLLEANGYEIWHLDFADRLTGNVGYDPMRSLVYDEPYKGCPNPNETSALSIAAAICPDAQFAREPYWAQSAQRVIAALVLLAAESAPEGCASFSDVIRLYEGLFEIKDRKRKDDNGGRESVTSSLIRAFAFDHPQSRAVSMWNRAANVANSPVTWACIISQVDNAMRVVATREARRMFECPNQIDFTQLAQKRVAMFITVSDNDPSMRPITNLFITQAFNQLIRYADKECKDGRLEHPVRFMLDDFSNLYVPNIADILSVVRSREIWVTMLCQSVMQLNARYGQAEAMSIVANCDTQLLLGFCDNATAEFYSLRANKPASALLNSVLTDVWLFIRGRGPERLARYDLEDHPRYAELPEAKKAA